MSYFPRRSEWFGWLESRGYVQKILLGLAKDKGVRIDRRKLSRKMISDETLLHVCHLLRWGCTRNVILQYPKILVEQKTPRPKPAKKRTGKLPSRAIASPNNSVVPIGTITHDRESSEFFQCLGCGEPRRNDERVIPCPSCQDNK